MGKYFGRAIGGGYRCFSCGKIVQEYGQPAHRGWHIRQSLKKQGLPNEKPREIKVFAGFEDFKPEDFAIIHKATCNCQDCFGRRETTGQ